MGLKLYQLQDLINEAGEEKIEEFLSDFSCPLNFEKSLTEFVIKRKCK